MESGIFGVPVEYLYLSGFVLFMLFMYPIGILLQVKIPRFYPPTELSSSDSLLSGEVFELFGKQTVVLEKLGFAHFCYLDSHVPFGRLCETRLIQHVFSNSVEGTLASHTLFLSNNVEGKKSYWQNLTFSKPNSDTDDLIVSTDTNLLVLKQLNNFTWVLPQSVSVEEQYRLFQKAIQRNNIPSRELPKTVELLKTRWRQVQEKMFQEFEAKGMFAQRKDGHGYRYRYWHSFKVTWSWLVPGARKRVSELTNKDLAALRAI